MSKHTPGPWKVAESRMGWDIIVRNAVDAPVCSAIDAGYNKKTAEANARLIAAAPELLEAVREAHAWVKHWQRDFEANLKPTESSLSNAASLLDRAIAKAEGRT